MRWKDKIRICAEITNKNMRWKDKIRRWEGRTK